MRTNERMNYTEWYTEKEWNSLSNNQQYRRRNKHLMTDEIYNNCASGSREIAGSSIAKTLDAMIYTMRDEFGYDVDREASYSRLFS